MSGHTNDNDSVYSVRRTRTRTFSQDTQSRRSYSDSFVSDSDDEVSKSKSRAKKKRSPGSVYKDSIRKTRKKGQQKTTPRTSDPIKQRVMSAKRLRANELRNHIDELTNQISELKDENKLLKLTERRQDKALQRFEGKESDLSNIVTRHTNEIHNFKEQLRKYKDKCELLNRKNKDLGEELGVTKRQLKRLKELSNNKQLGEREVLSQKLNQSEADIYEKNKRIQELERHVEHLKKNHRHEVGVEVHYHREKQRRIEELEELVEKLSIQIKEKEKELDIKNIYSNRIIRRPHKLPSAQSTPVHRGSMILRNGTAQSELAMTPREKAKLMDEQRRQEDKREREPSDDHDSIKKITEEKNSVIDSDKSVKIKHNFESSGQNKTQSEVPSSIRPPLHGDFRMGDHAFENKPLKKGVLITQKGPSLFQPSVRKSTIPQEKSQSQNQSHQNSADQTASPSITPFFVTETSPRAASRKFPLEAREERRKAKATKGDNIGTSVIDNNEVLDGVEDDIIEEGVIEREESEEIDFRKEQEAKQREQIESEARRRMEEEERIRIATEKYQQELREKKEQELKEREEQRLRHEREEEERKRNELERLRKEKEERDRIEQANRQAELEANNEKILEERRRKDILLAKLRAMDEGRNPDEVNDVKEEKTFTRHDSGSLHGSASSKKRYSFSKPIENLHHGKPSHDDVTVPYIERQRRKSLFDDEVEDIGYKPSFNDSSFHQGNSAEKQKANKKKDLMKELFGDSTKANAKNGDVVNISDNDSSAFASRNKEKKNSSGFINLNDKEQSNDKLLPRRPRHASTTFKPIVNAVDDFDDELEEVII
ncbi:uncharacterized protein LOC141914786 isoform X1 [Tubulanus polymorphus]|uniref:uncharacterized protein LOC141914786 isoform X1 n=1 Tax=Tubulanus polymorphus TaxID=672921 RepID=UPI003DA5393E